MSDDESDAWPGLKPAGQPMQALRAADNTDPVRRGSPFSIDALTPARQASPTRSARGAGGPDAPIGVLVVDDDSRVRAAIVETIALEADLFLVAEAADANTAVAAVERTHPSVALVDVLLPDADTGLALVTVLARRPDSAVVAMSVRSGLGTAAVAAGAVDFVEKGGDVQAVLDALRAAVPPHQV